MITESFLPQVNGVTNSVLRVGEHLQRRGDQTLIIAPGPGPTQWAGASVVRVPSSPLPGHADFRLARPWPGLSAALRDFAPDVVHLASPTVLGAQAAFVARRLRLPVVAVYQTDLAGFARRYGLMGADLPVWTWLRTIHALAGRTLAPSKFAVAQLRSHGVLRVVRWARGVDLTRFHPANRDAGLHEQLAPRGELVVGYVGRLAQEKQLDLLVGVDRMPGVRLVIVGDGPQRRQLRSQLPNAQFLGVQGGAELAATFASLDIFVHTGAHETFCQAAQEALASGVPVVAPKAGGLIDMVDHGRTGRFFAPGSGSDLATQVSALAADPAARALMGQAARASVQGRGWDVIGDELVEHYRQVISA